MPQETTQPTRTRKRPNLRLAHANEFTIRFATNADGFHIRDLINAMLINYGTRLPDADWQHIEPYWIVAERDRQLLGCVQTIHSKPSGVLDLFAVRPGLPKPTKAKIMKSLLFHGMAALQHAGCSWAIAQAAAHDRMFTAALQRYGAAPAHQLQLYVWTL